MANVRKSRKNNKENIVAGFYEEQPPIEPNQPEPTSESEYVGDTLPAEEVVEAEPVAPAKVVKPKPPMLSDEEFEWDF